MSTTSIRVTPQTVGQFRYWARHINAVRSAQDTAGTGIVLDVHFPGLEIMMPVPEHKVRAARRSSLGDIVRR